MISARSNYYRTVQLVSPLTSVECTQYTMRIWIWAGTAGMRPVTPNYEITRLNYASSSGSEKIEIGKLINSFIETGLTTLTGSSVNQNTLNQYWTKTTIEYVTGESADIGLEQDPITIIALYSYGYGNEGENWQIPAGVQLSGTIYKTSKSSLFSIPVYCSAAYDVTIDSLPNHLYTSSFTLASSVNTTSMFKLIVIDTSMAGSDSQILVTIEAQTIRILLDDDEKHINTDLYFINKYGCQQTISMRKQRKESIVITGEKYEGFGLQPSDGYHQFPDFNVNGKSSIQLNSGYIPESNNSAIKELMLSEKIWMAYNGSTVPVNLKSKSLEYKTRINDLLVNYVLDFEYSYNEINNA